MSDQLKGLFGGGTDDGVDNDDKRTKLRDFSQRYKDGNPAEGYSDDEAKQNFARVMKTASPEQIQQAVRKTYENLPDNQRSELAQMIEDRKRGHNMVQIEHSGGGSAAQGGGGDPLSDLFGGLMGGSGGSGGLGGLLGGLLGGGNESNTSSSGSSGGGLGGLLGGLLGGNDDDNQQTTQTQTGNAGATQSGGIEGQLGGLLSGPMGKVIMGGIAAFAADQILGNK